MASKDFLTRIKACVCRFSRILTKWTVTEIRLVAAPPCSELLPDIIVSRTSIVNGAVHLAQWIPTRVRKVCLSGPIRRPGEAITILHLP